MQYEVPLIEGWYKENERWIRKSSRCCQFDWGGHGWSTKAFHWGMFDWSWWRLSYLIPRKIIRRKKWRIGENDGSIGRVRNLNEGP